MMGPLLWALFPLLGSEGHLLDFFQGQTKPASPLRLEGKIFLLLNTRAKESQASTRASLVAITHPESQEAGWLFESLRYAPHPPPP